MNMITMNHPIVVKNDILDGFLGNEDPNWSEGLEFVQEETYRGEISNFKSIDITYFIPKRN